MRSALWTVGLCVLLMPSPSMAAPAATIDVVDFDASVRTLQGGYFQCIGALPDRLRDSLVTVGSPACGAWRLEVSADAPPTGVGGLIALRDPSGSAQPLDARNAPFLQVRLIGELGQRKLRIEVLSGTGANAAVSGVLVGVLDAAALSPQAWVEKSLPVDGASASALGAIRMTLEGEGPAWIAVDAVWFSASESPPAGQCAPPASPAPVRQALWVWETRKYLSEPGEVEALLAFCKAHAITDLFWQVPYTRGAEGEIELLHLDRQRAFNLAAHQAGMRMHALDGGPDFVLRENHVRMFKLVEALDAFNRAGPTEARYFGVHMDNEPHVLKAWKEGPAQQQDVIQSYMELNRALSAQVKAAGMEYGVDIPFWWDKLDESGQPAFKVRTDAGEVPLLDALFPLLQNAGIMSYRVRALGGNGVVDCCRTEFALGARLGVGVFASVELGTGEKVEPGITFGVYSASYFQTQLETLQRVLPQERGCIGIAIHYYHAYREFLEK